MLSRSPGNRRRFDPCTLRMKRMIVAFDVEDDDPIEVGDCFQADIVTTPNGSVKIFGYFSGEVIEARKDCPEDVESK